VKSMAKNLQKIREEKPESFVLRLHQPSCIKKDKSFDVEKLKSLIQAAQKNDENTKMLIFEQYQGLWKNIIADFRSSFEPAVYDFEDLQQEAMVALLIALKNYNQDIENTFSVYFGNVFRNHLNDILRIKMQLVEGNLKAEQLCSLDTPGPDRETYYQIGIDPETIFFSETYPRIQALLTPKEFFVALYHYQYGYSIKTVAQALKISTRAVDKIIAKIKDKLSAVELRS